MSIEERLAQARETRRSWPDPTDETPSEEDLQDMVSGDAWATDGCGIEPDGTCEHGYPSWLLWLGWI